MKWLDVLIGFVFGCWLVTIISVVTFIYSGPNTSSFNFGAIYAIKAIAEFQEQGRTDFSMDDIVARANQIERTTDFKLEKHSWGGGGRSLSLSP